MYAGMQVPPTSLSQYLHLHQPGVLVVLLQDAVVSHQELLGEETKKPTECK